MMKRLLLVFLLSISSVGVSQNSKFALELNHQIPIDDNFIGKNYNGIIELGIAYNFWDLGIVTIGASLNSGFLKNSKDDRMQPFNVRLFTIQPRIVAELNIENLPKLHPSLGLGYSLLNFKADLENNFEPHSADDTVEEFGFNLNVGLAYDISDKFFLKAQFDFIKISADDNVPDIPFNTNINILKIGLGYRF